MIVDCLRSWRAPLNPSEVIAACVVVLKPYRIRNVVGDNFSGEFAPEGFRKNGINYELSDKNRSQLYLGLIPVMCSGKVELLDNPRMANELRELERKVGRSGRDSVDHRPGFDEAPANATAGVVNVVMRSRTMPIRLSSSSVEQRLVAYERWRLRQ